VAYPIQWGARCKKLIALSQSADSGNGLAAIDELAGIGLPLQLKQISSGMPKSAISQ
jgi:hypothetical protein